MIKLSNYKYFFAICDFLLILFCIYESLFFIRYYNNSYFPFDLYPTLLFILLALFISIYFLIIFHLNNLYKLNVILIKSKHFTNIVKSFFYGIVGIILLSFTIKFPLINNSRLLVLTFAITATLAFFLVRVVILRKLFLYMNKNNMLIHNVVIWGAGKAGQLLAAKIQFENHFSLNILGFIDDKKLKGEKVLDDLYVLGNATDLENLNNNKLVDEVIIAIDNIDYNMILDILDFCKNIEINVKLTSELFNIVHQKIDTEFYSGIPVIDLSNKLNPKANILLKRLIDIFGSFMGLVILSPIFILISLIIKLTSEGPVFYKQKRIGKNGKPFTFYKFRSMLVSKDGDKEREKMMIEFIKSGNNENNYNNKIINNARVTKIGYFIRKKSLDELPQLINVLKGDMSLVGPRPCLPYEYTNYAEWQKRRFGVLPGCTGVWQVSGRNSVSFNDSIVLDIYYINNISPWLDLQLIFKTFPVMFLGKGEK